MRKFYYTCLVVSITLTFAGCAIGDVEKAVCSGVAAIFYLIGLVMVKVDNEQCGRLKPCPFCGGVANTGYAINDRNCWSVYCTRCWASTETKDIDTEEKAIELWNKRTADEH